MSGHRNWLDFRVGIELTWFQWCRRNKLYSCVGDRIRLGSKLTCFWSRGANWLCAGWNWLIFIGVIDWLGISVGGRNWLGFEMRDANRFVLVWASEWTWLVCVSGGNHWISVLAHRPFKNSLKRSGPQLLVSAEWVAQLFYPLWTNKRGPGFKSHQSPIAASSEMHHNTTARP